MFRFVFFAFLVIFSYVARADVIPFTVGDLQAYKSLDGSGKLNYLIDFYKKNKAVGATDGEIINEIVKIDDIQNDPVFKMFSRFSSKIKDLDGYVRTAVNDINREISLKNPGRDDLFINPDDSSTWKNIQYMAVGDRRIKDYIDDYSKNKFFSKPAYTDRGAVVLASCARTRGKTEVLMGYMVLLDEDLALLQQKEGEPKIPMTVDFSGSENVVVGNLAYPLQQYFPALGGLGYAAEAVLPFAVDIKNLTKPAVVRAVLTANVCKNTDCAVKTFPQIEYEIPQSFLESSICTELEQTLYNAPANRHAGITIKSAGFQSKNGVTDLIVRIEKPFSFSGQPDLQIANEVGLRFEAPFVGKDGDVFFYRARLKNPEKIAGKKEIPLTLTVYNAVKSDEFSINVKTRGGFFQSTATTFSGCLSAFFMGVSFVFFTPLLSAWLMLVYALVGAPNRSVPKAGEFFDGLASAAKYVLTFYAILLLIGLMLPKAVFWGVQFESPWLNFVYAAVFCASAFVLPKLFDNIFACRFNWGKTKSVNEKAGFATGIVCGGLLLFTPEISRFYEIYGLLRQSPIVYGALFLFAIAMLFSVAALFDGVAAKEIPPLKGAKTVIVLPLVVQAVLLLFLAGLESGLPRGIGAFVLLGGGIAAMFKFNKKKTAAVVGVVSLVVLPLVPNEYDFNTLGARDFDERALTQAVQDGKTVYLNVTESGCLMCQMNRMTMMYRGGREEIKQGRLIVMGIPYSHPFVRRLLDGTGQDVLPANVIFAPNAPSGKVLPSVIGPWLAPDIVREYVQPLSKSTN